MDISFGVPSSKHVPLLTLTDSDTTLNGQCYTFKYSLRPVETRPIYSRIKAAYDLKYMSMSVRGNNA